MYVLYFQVVNNFKKNLNNVKIKVKIKCKEKSATVFG